ncbi:hypothetical protein K443DRAFT_125961 [Laccaria amethystina LaAM-08-1]|uniref:Secreted protein n=1 Tax=Laccaria amethystina LaAM-08-1 TaxID=1095629 RepID=A0A0C9WUZ4_9AGAR|nr:hypothetical protein K443DRAFT_125961 [Laccaria amethystina LaAM-08-1]
MKSSFFYVIVALCVTAQAVSIVRSPGSDVAAENDSCTSTGRVCGVDSVMRRPSFPLSTSPSDNFLFYFLFLTIGSSTVQPARSALLTKDSAVVPSATSSRLRESYLSMVHSE